MSSVWADVLQVADERELAVLSDEEFRQLVDDIVGRYVARPTSVLDLPRYGGQLLYPPYAAPARRGGARQAS